MRIKYVTNGVEREVRDSLGEHLIRRGIAREVKAEAPKAKPPAAAAPEPVEISERTGKPKREYKRRDMRAED